MITKLVDDFTRIVAVFGSNLIDTPSSIFKLIPILCPSETLFHQKFGQENRQRLVSGFNRLWDERLSSMLFPSRALFISCNDQYIGVGLADGTIRKHRASTFEHVATLRHGEPVRRLVLGAISNIMASCGTRHLTVWDSQHNQKWRIPLAAVPLSLAFSSDESTVYVPTKTGDVLKFRVTDGEELEPFPTLDDSSESDSDGEARIRKGATPDIVRLYPELGLMGMAFRYSHLKLCGIESDEKTATFERRGYEGQKVSPQILDIAFNPLKENSLGAAAYQDGEVVVFNTYTLQQKAMYTIYACILAASPDGRTLCVGDTEGCITVLGFETLRPMYRIATIEDHLTGIVFASNSMRFFDIRENSCNVWEPSILMHENSAESSDDTSSLQDDQVLTVQEARSTRHFDEDKRITVMTQAGSSNFLFCGRADGTISYHDSRSGRQLEELNYHAARTVSIRYLYWHVGTETLFSVDAAGRCLGTRLVASKSGQLQKRSHVLNLRTVSAVNQVLVRQDGLGLLISTVTGEELWESDSTENGFSVTSHSNQEGQWLNHPGDASKLLLLQEGMIRVFSWEGLKSITDGRGVALFTSPCQSPPPLTSKWFCRQGGDSIFTIHRDPEATSAEVFALSTPSQYKADEPWKLTSYHIPSMPQMKDVLGVYRSNLYFQSTQGWICSLSLKTLPILKSYTRHFFIPALWQTGTDFDLVGTVVPSKSIAFAYKDELVIFYSFLEFEDKIDLQIGQI